MDNLQQLITQLETFKLVIIAPIYCKATQVAVRNTVLNLHQGGSAAQLPSTLFKVDSLEAWRRLDTSLQQLIQASLAE